MTEAEKEYLEGVEDGIRAAMAEAEVLYNSRYAATRLMLIIPSRVFCCGAKMQFVPLHNDNGVTHKSHWWCAKCHRKDECTV